MAKVQSLRSQIATAADGCFDTIGVNKSGNIIIRRGYFYSGGLDSTKFANSIAQLIASSGIPLKVANHGNQWRAFRGGASVANSSHFWVELTAV